MRALISVFDDDGKMIDGNRLITPSSIKYVNMDNGSYVTKYTFTFETSKMHCYNRKEDNYGTCEEKENIEE